MMNLVAYFREATPPLRESEERMSSGLTKRYADRKHTVGFVSETLRSGCVLYTLLPGYQFCSPNTHRGGQPR
jgi:hypothetical protein